MLQDFGVVGGGKWGTVGQGVGKVAAPQELNEQPQNATEFLGRACAESRQRRGKGLRRMFLGTYTPKLDDKGRLTLPAKFRNELSDGLMVTKGQDHSLAVYPKDEFEKLAARATKASRTNPKARAFVRNLAASTDEQALDASGRVTLSADHRRYAGLAKECVVIGSIDFLEIWDSESWEAYQAEHEENFSEGEDDSLFDVL